MSNFTTTTNFALKKPTVGQAVDLWGTYLNSNFDEIDSQLQTLTVSIQTPDLEGLGNVLNTTPATNDFLRFNGESWAAATVSIPSSIDDLSDVDTSTTAPITGQALVWSGSSWSPSTPTAATIDDGSITTAKLDTGLQTQIGRILVTDDDDSPTDGQILQYSTADTEWKYADLPGSTVVTLGDVNSGSLADNALLVYNSSAGEFQFESGATLRSTLGVDVAGTDNSTDLSISSATSYDYIVLSAGQILTINQVNLGTDVTGTLPVAQGGTGGTTASAARTALGLGTIATQDSDDVTITGGNISGIVDLAIADGGTGASSVGAARTNLGLGSLATQDTITESQISDLGSYITASSTNTLTNKSGNISQWTNDAGYLTAETNDLTNVSGTLGTGNGGTGLSAIGTAYQVLAVNAGATALEFQTLATGGTVTSVAVSGSDGIEVDSGSPVTSSGTIALGINATSLSTHLGLGTISTQASDSVSITGGSITGVTDIAIADGGTGASTEADARSNLLPSYSGNGSKVLALNSGGTDVEWVTQSQVFTAGVANAFEHANSISDNITVVSGNNRLYIGDTTFSGTLTVAGKMVILDGPINLTGTMNLIGTLSVRR
jgi:hypothetical protein